MSDDDALQTLPGTLPTRRTVTSLKARAPVVLTLLVFATVAFALAFSNRDPSHERLAHEPEKSRAASSLVDPANTRISARVPETMQQAPSIRGPEKTAEASVTRDITSGDSLPLGVFGWILILVVIILAGYELVIACLSGLGLWVALLTAGLLFQLPNMLAIRTLGMIFVAAASLIILHRLHHRGFRNVTFFVGFALGLTAFWCAINGTLLRLERSGIDDRGVEATSVAVYEATQVLMMDMAPHEITDEATGKPETSSASSKSSDSDADTQSQPNHTERRGEPGVIDQHSILRGASDDERDWFKGARIFATLFALFLVYQALTHFSRSTRYRAHMLLLRCKLTHPDACLVCGIGQVGFRLVQELQAERRSVIVLEKNEDHANLKATIETGAIVLTADASRAETIDDLPLNAISHVYVTCGDDAVNLEVAMNVKRAFQADEAKHARLRRAVKYLRGFFKNDDQKGIDKRNGDACQCHVQILDPEMQAILHHTFHHEASTRQNITFHPFNADLNAVRNLIQDELTLLRPQHNDEVGLYVVVGLDNRWEEVVLGLANLAHFENRRRSRILVITANPEDDAKSLLARYPRLTVDNPVHTEWSSVRFNPLADDWSCTFPGTTRGRKETFEIPKPGCTSKSRLSLLKPLEKDSANPFARLFVKCSAQFLESIHEGSQYKDVLNLRPASPESIIALAKVGGQPVEAGGEAWLEVEGVRNRIVDWARDQRIDIGSAFELTQWGVEFATQTLFTKLPVVPGDDEFLSFLHRLIDEHQWQQKSGSAPANIAATESPQRRIKPVMIVAGRDDSRNFTWASTFARRWERFRGRHCVRPPAKIGNEADMRISEITDMSVFVWISEQESLRELLKRNPVPGKQSDGTISKSDSTLQHAARGGKNVNAGTGDSNRSTVVFNAGVISDGCRSFGDPKEAAGRNAVHEKSRRYLSAASASAYDFVTEKLHGKSATPSNANSLPRLQVDPEEYDHYQSNNHAADHAIIKLAMILDDLSTWQSLTSSCRSLEPEDDLNRTFTGVFKDHNASIKLISIKGTSQKVTHDSDRLLVIAEVEHNRWCAELLLRNAIWQPVELKLNVEGNPKPVRPPESIHIRKTLRTWQQIKTDPNELEKDIEQVWFILHAFAARTKES